MKQTSRKKVLVSSVAMMMVATVSLGSATYAWFTSSTTATANNINVKTIQSSELVISKTGHTWGTQIDYNVKNKVLQPTSTVNGEAWFTANANVKGNYAKADDKEFKPIDDAKNYYFADQINVANKGAADVKNAKISFTFPSNDYARVAIVEADVNGKIKGDFKTAVFDNAGKAYNGVSGVAATEKITPKTTTYEVSVGDLKGKGEGEEMGDAKYYNIYVWFEGQDEQCIDANAGQEIPDIEISVTGQTDDQQQ